MTDGIMEKFQREHATMERVLGLMQGQLEKVDHGGTPDLVLFGIALYYMRKFPSVVHHPAEELLFDLVLKRSPCLKGDIGFLRDQHSEIYHMENWLLEASIAGMKQGEPAYPRLLEYGRRYLLLQREHRTIEERLVYPRAVAVLGEEDWKSQEAGIRALDDSEARLRLTARFLPLYGYLAKYAPEYALAGA